MSASWRAVTFGARPASGYVQGAAHLPGVVLLQEWWGVTAEIKSLGDRLASQGFRVLIPDLYDGKLALDVAEAEHNMQALDWVRAKAEIAEAADYLKSEGSPRVGATGTCMGGALALVAAQHAAVSCAAPFYGTPDPALVDVAKIAVPVQGHFGALDDLAGFSDPTAAEKLRRELASGACPESEVFVYDNAGHGFMNSAPDQPRINEDVSVPTGFPKAQPDVQVLAWERLVAFFDKHLLK